MESSNPENPFGNQPPCDQRFEMPVAIPPFPNPNKIIPAPTTIIQIIVTILMRANQNSSSPNTFTDKKLKALINNRASKAQVQRGISGNQYCM
ncbi:Uncharacterised protein [Streptococcus pneumoniae]|nr:Uncharacterised protein [Streptococcus pneumoniae]